MGQLITRRGLVVSCQAYENEPLFGADHMAEMAKAAVLGGAIGIRANGTADIAAIKNKVNVPVIGLVKQQIGEASVYITPTLQTAYEAYEAGADIVAIDGTKRARPDGKTLREVVEALHLRNIPVMADISTVEEGLYAVELGVEYISTTLSGYTPYSPQTAEPDVELVRQLAQLTDIPVVAEGRYRRSSDMVEALKAGAQFVVVGTAITRPQFLTELYLKAMQEKVGI
ncbi:N-acetylmannosamine-6-phosphate 2-epimerase [Paenibacillus sp. 1001270B_150601_E10]|uniref:N-acetylmannosamine-6-phosphate 2-epimerase n=1 Tax=Paenibacillus sp. 1001270B_150601_E10 TaxID=2787079 RepID=UPI00189DDD57|nr:N-acetylmannosamine-6-phosphate 2-epimerase [Paenibacillus sp. 1001270B_150601_E10]